MAQYSTKYCKYNTLKGNAGLRGEKPDTKQSWTRHSRFQSWWSLIPVMAHTLWGTGPWIFIHTQEAIFINPSLKDIIPLWKLGYKKFKCSLNLYKYLIFRQKHFYILYISITTPWYQEVRKSAFLPHCPSFLTSDRRGRASKGAKLKNKHSSHKQTQHVPTPFSNNTTTSVPSLQNVLQPGVQTDGIWLSSPKCPSTVPPAFQNSAVLTAIFSVTMLVSLSIFDFIYLNSCQRTFIYNEKIYEQISLVVP